MPENVPSVTVTLDRPRRLVYTHGSMRRAREVTGNTVPDLAGDDGMLLIGPFIWACLAKEDRDITPEEIDDLIYPSMRNELIRALGELFRKSTPESEGNADEPVATEAAS